MLLKDRGVSARRSSSAIPNSLLDIFECAPREAKEDPGIEWFSVGFVSRSSRVSSMGVHLCLLEPGSQTPAETSPTGVEHAGKWVALADADTPLSRRIPQRACYIVGVFADNGTEDKSSW
ncbi:hypothetical protein DSL72_002689 [Monilinia vaccinii-corymbosi]|uniref:Uncharacterized protein n=1 Tax=Monilinia vaccinii-corymbosi TaxID=61207 RepID=A0A8A3PDE0_9HELO|nr:hypothetical protein DSL72_002689 [Monilinia vaccinii-corymbosi]